MTKEVKKEVVKKVDAVVEEAKKTVEKKEESLQIEKALNEAAAQKIREMFSENEALALAEAAVQNSEIIFDVDGITYRVRKTNFQEKQDANHWRMKKYIEFLRDKDCLLEKDLKVTPGAIEFKYTSRRKEEKRAILQYIVIYSPLSSKKGEILIRFYSPYPLEPPQNVGSIGGTSGMYTELTHDLSPFIVEIRGNVEDYKWVGWPTMDISFPPEVPDLGIKPLTFWEKHFLKPIQTAIKEVEIIITKVSGGTPDFVDIWEQIKSFFSKFNRFSTSSWSKFFICYFSIFFYCFFSCKLLCYQSPIPH